MTAPQPKKHFAQLAAYVESPEEAKKKKKKHRQTRPEVKLRIDFWEEAELAAKRIPGTLELFECDPGKEGDETGAKDTLLATFDVHLDSNPDWQQDGDPKVRIRWADWQREELFREDWAKKTGSSKLKRIKNRYQIVSGKQAAFDLLLFKTRKKRWQRYPIMVPDLLEGTEYELGFRLTTEENDAKQVFEVLSATNDSHLVPIPAKDWLGAMLEFPKRFDDPLRNPPVPPKEVVAKLEEKVDELLGAAKPEEQESETLNPFEDEEEPEAGEDEDAEEDEDDQKPIDLDGLPFSRFLKEGQTRADVVRQILADNPKLGKEEHLGTGDIVKAFFIVHDVANRGPNVYRMDKMNRLYRKKTSWYMRNVHGFLNVDGSYIPTVDFVANRQGTVFDGGAVPGTYPFIGYTIHIECVPGFAKTKGKLRGAKLEEFLAPHRETMKAEGGHIGWKHQGGETDCLMWNKALLDSLADLYVMASARAGHLLTVTGHKEMDRNLVWDWWVPQIDAQIRREKKRPEKRGGPREDELAKLKGRRSRAVGKAKGLHGDPRGIDMQGLYVRITNKLNVLLGDRGPKLPLDARYGIHPLRFSKNEANITNMTGHKHTFPHQSNPKHRRGRNKH